MAIFQREGQFESQRGGEIELDGEKHSTEICLDSEYCHEKLCPGCKIWMHFQAFYQGNLYVCPDCNYSC